MRKKILTIVGARPQFIKAATVSRCLCSHNSLEEILVHTGQHYDNNMSSIFFDELSLAKPQYNLGIGSGSHGQQTGEMLVILEKILLDEKPQWVLIYGDTNSTLAGALAAAKLNIPIAHVEAGLRSFNRRMPEEINRILADQLSTLLFAPTESAVKNLQNEGCGSDRIHQVGDVMFDAAIYYAHKAETHSQILQRLKLRSKEYVLATVHRQENTDDIKHLEAIMEGLSLVAQEIPVVIPLHPRTQKMLIAYDLKERFAKTLIYIDPVGFLDMIQLEKNAKVIATDSGGVQKEAFFYKTPCVTLRNETEWVELVTLGYNILAHPDNSQHIYAMITQAVDIEMQEHIPFIYGQGQASQKILEILSQ